MKNNKKKQKEKYSKLQVILIFIFAFILFYSLFNIFKIFINPTPFPLKNGMIFRFHDENGNKLTEEYDNIRYFNGKTYYTCDISYSNMPDTSTTISGFMDKKGVFLISKTFKQKGKPDNTQIFEPPTMVIKLPLFINSKWAYELLTSSPVANGVIIKQNPIDPESKILHSYYYSMSHDNIKYKNKTVKTCRIDETSTDERSVKISYWVLQNTGVIQRSIYTDSGEVIYRLY